MPKKKKEVGEVFPQNSDSSGPRSLGEIEDEGGKPIYQRPSRMQEKSFGALTFNNPIVHGMVLIGVEVST